MSLWPRIVDIINEAIPSSRPKKQEGGFMPRPNFAIGASLVAIGSGIVKEAVARQGVQPADLAGSNTDNPAGSSLESLKKANQASENSPTADSKPAEAAQGCPVTESEKPPCKCAKAHIDLRGTSVQWQTQFDPQWGDRTAQNVACWKTSHAILINSGLGEGSGSQAGMYQVAEENEDHSAMIINTDIAKQGIGYIDGQLESNHPVLVGVDHDLNYRGGMLNEGTTDHYIVIVGRACDDGNIYYLFYDVGTGFENKGASDDNKLFIDLSDYSLKGNTVYNGKLYTVTQVRLNN